MRRAQLVLVVLAASALGGCARWYDRNAQLGSDPVLWFLGGAPTEASSHGAGSAEPMRAESVE